MPGILSASSEIIRLVPGLQACFLPIPHTIIKWGENVVTSSSSSSEYPLAAGCVLPSRHWGCSAPAWTQNTAGVAWSHAHPPSPSCPSRSKRTPYSSPPLACLAVRAASHAPLRPRAGRVGLVRGRDRAAPPVPLQLHRWAKSPHLSPCPGGPLWHSHFPAWAASSAPARFVAPRRRRPRAGLRRLARNGPAGPEARVAVGVVWCERFEECVGGFVPGGEVECCRAHKSRRPRRKVSVHRACLWQRAGGRPPNFDRSNMHVRRLIALHPAGPAPTISAAPSARGRASHSESTPCTPSTASSRGCRRPTAWRT